MESAGALAASIQAKWQSRLAHQDGHGSFLRHLDGNLENSDPNNLECVHPFDAFAAMYHKLGWCVDWSVGLTQQEADFVQGNLWNFCVSYAEFDPEQDAQVIQLTEEADAAMESGAFDRAVELYEAAKAQRELTLFGSSVHLADDLSSDASSKSLPRYGRRSAGALNGNLPSVCVSTPSRRVQPDGAPTRKEEVAARVAARK